MGSDWRLLEAFWIGVGKVGCTYFQALHCILNEGLLSLSLPALTSFVWQYNTRLTRLLSQPPTP